MISKQSGFSLIEVSIVVGISAVMLLTVGSFSTTMDRSVRVRLDSYEVLEVLYQARALARSLGRCVTVFVEDQRLTTRAFDVTDCTPPFIDPPIEESVFDRIAPTLQLNAFTGGNPVIFNPLGAPVWDEPSSMEITDGDNSRFITMFPKSGYIRMGAWVP